MSISVSLVYIAKADIVFLSDRDAGGQDRSADVYTMSDDGDNTRRLTTDLLYKSHPVFSPNGSQVVFAIELVKPGGWEWEPQQTVELFLMNSNGSSQRQLTEYKGLSTQPSWDPEGNRIAFTSTHSGGLEIHIMDISTGVVTQITNASAEVGGTASDPDWSPDGRKIAYSLVLGGQGRFIYLTDINGKDSRPLVKDQKLEVGITEFNTRAKWHPDNEHILYRSSAFNIEEKDDVHVVKQAVKTRLIVRSENNREFSVLNIPEHLEFGGGSWAEDGNAVIFPAAIILEDGIGNTDIYKYDMRTHQVTNISNHPSSDFLPDWTENAFSVPARNMIATQWSRIKKND